MAVQTITYGDKSYLNELPDIPATNKVQDVDMNEIKSVVNNNANELSNIKLKLLWNNPNETSDFASQVITLSSDDYDYLIIYWLNYKTTERLCNTSTLKGYGAYLNLASDYNIGGNNYNVASYIREFNRTSDTIFTFTDCYTRYGTSATRPVSNSNIVPVAIYGAKF